MSPGSDYTLDISEGMLRLAAYLRPNKKNITI